MPQYQEKTIVTRVERFTDTNIRLTLKSPDIARAASPGQFVMIKAGSGMDPLLRRPFSIHQIYPKDHIQIYFKIVGRGTQILADAREGEDLSVFGPLGHGFDLDSAAPACIIGGGLGIAPMLFLADELCRQKKDTTGDILLLGGSSKSEIAPLANDFQAVGLETLFTTDDGSYGKQGYVTETLRSLDLPENTVVYGCGPEAMMAAVNDLCQKRGWRCQVSVESVMACGMGACLGCNRPSQRGGYVHVCIDGPVFNSGELIWNG